LLGFILFSDRGLGMAGLVEKPRHSDLLALGEAPDGKSGNENLEVTSTPLPEVQAAKASPSQTPATSSSEGEDFWRMAGLRNVKLTPTFRSEDNRIVKGAVLEGETLTGALVVWAF
jgi:hypothetical protein